jgi:hypothetical protein
MVAAQNHCSKPCYCASIANTLLLHTPYLSETGAETGSGYYVVSLVINTKSRPPTLAAFIWWNLPAFHVSIFAPSHPVHQQC